MELVVEQRFWAKVDKSGDCWLWMAGKRNGYGRFWVNGKILSAHRLAYELSGEKIPTGMDLDHLCRTTDCVRPAHLEPVTHRENIHRGVSPVAIHARTTHCPAGHEYSAENTYQYPNHRMCKTCTKARVAGYRKARIANAN